MIGEELAEDDGDEDAGDVEKIEPLGDITHWKTGRNVAIYVDPSDPKTYYKVKPFKAASPIAKTTEKVKALLAQRVDLQKMITAATLSMEQLEEKADRLRRSLRLGSVSMDEAEANISPKKKRHLEMEDEDESPRPKKKLKKKKSEADEDGFEF
jgi:hypothetical protein